MQISLEAARVNAKLTQQQAADILGISRMAYLRRENAPAKFSYQQVQKLCETFGVQPSDIHQFNINDSTQ